VNPYVFIVGCPRSGTTLLRRIVDAHPDIAITRETHWITKVLEGDGGVSPFAPVSHDLLPRLEAHPKFQRMGVDRSELEDLLSREEPVSYAELVTRVFDLYGEAQGKRLVGDKVPDYVRYLPLLHRLWPAAKFVHLIRDGRDVCSSMLTRERFARRFATWDDDPIATGALAWEQLVRLGRESGAELPAGLYHEMRYEALVAEPAGECRTLCDFLGVPFDDAMLRFNVGRTRSDAGLDAKKAWRPVTPGLRSWRSDLPEPAVERFEAAAGGLLAELGYPRAVPDPAPPVRRRVERLRDAFEQHARARGKQLPERWGL
jgi:Sulfotransferase family